MFAFKSCPRCRGDVYIGPDADYACLQCGHELRPGERAALLARRTPLPLRSVPAAA